MTRFYVFKDGMMIFSTISKDEALDTIRHYQAMETHYMLRANFSIIKGEEELVPYKNQRSTRTA